ncbi:nucleoside diphosphate kinase regulator [Pseudomaricurvus sp. HS19]|uniref:nucleoside diphosphate kinase regulator n=1 Tax=Pseudomaricurvus sp. HS19 TaxID=2692626 RepID=UPI00136FC9C4|nr:nucleoside diphosphate kinase regulator [Pseudomaricurvus sp. HS19]MYM63436.1 nucleoside diphosphate kinase regulator [Pseudomaricurvus sp. HS19]
MRKRRNSQIYLKESEYNLLLKLLERMEYTDSVAALEEELSRAKVVPGRKLGKDVACLNATVTYVDEESGQQTRVQLVLPADASVQDGRISVLSPVGSALLGLKTNGYIEWPLPSGKLRKLSILEVTQAAETEQPLA